MHRERLIENIVHEILLESLGVIDGLNDACNEILEAALQGKTNIDVMGDINVAIFNDVYKFNSQEEYEKWISDGYGEAHSSYRNYKGFLFVNISFPLIFVEGQLRYKETLGNIYHELEHIVQQHKIGKSFVETDSNSDAYLSLYNSPTNIYEQMVWTVAYFSYQYEREGFINGLYGELIGFVKDNGRVPTRNEINAIIKQSDLYNKMVIISNCIKETDNNRDYILKALEKYKLFNYTPKKLKYKARFILKDLQNRLRRVIAKFIADNPS